MLKEKGDGITSNISHNTLSIGSGCFGLVVVVCPDQSNVDSGVALPRGRFPEIIVVEAAELDELYAYVCSVERELVCLFTAKFVKEENIFHKTEEEIRTKITNSSISVADTRFQGMSGEDSVLLAKLIEAGKNPFPDLPDASVVVDAILLAIKAKKRIEELTIG